MINYSPVSITRERTLFLWFSNIKALGLSIVPEKVTSTELHLSAKGHYEKPNANYNTIPNKSPLNWGSKWSLRITYTFIFNLGEEGIFSFFLNQSQTGEISKSHISEWLGGGGGSLFQLWFHPKLSRPNTNRLPYTTFKRGPLTSAFGFLQAIFLSNSIVVGTLTCLITWHYRRLCRIAVC